MKKLFSMLMILVFVFGLSGCASNTELEDQITDLEKQIAELETANESYLLLEDTLTETLGERDETITALEAELAALQVLVFDNIITFTITNVDGELNNTTIGYNDEFDGTLFDLLDQNFEVGFSESEYGKYIYSLENLYPTNGSYISFSKNGNPSWVGVETQTFQDGDVFGFNIEWYDATEEAVFNAINLFLENQVENYITTDNMSYEVVVALKLLGKLDEYVDTADATTYLEGMITTTVTDYFKLIVMAEATGAMDVSLVYETFSTTATPGAYGQTAYGLLGLNATDHGEDYSAFETSALADLKITTPLTLGLDSGGISLVALSNYADETGVATLVSDFATWISTNQLESGGIKTKDSVWGDTTYPGTENAASMSQVILGLVANGIDPTSAEYTKANGDLVSRLCEFQTSTGTFDWDITDDISDDPMFSTPQAFLALVTYYTYSNTFAAVNPFNFNE